MSGSSSRFPGRAEPAMPMPGSYDPYDEPTTMVPSTEPPLYARQGPAGPNVPPAPEPASDLYVPTRGSDRGRKMKVMAPVVPPGSVTGRSLTLVIAIMCFLACLTAGAVWMIKESSDAWLNDIASEVTVQVTPQENGDTDKAVADVVSYLQKQRGIANVRALDLADSADLLQPWLGSGDALKSLPVPRLIAVEVDRNQPPDLAEVGQALTRDFKGVSLDDHRRWQQQIRAVTRSLALGGLAILALVAAATTAIIVSATRSAMASNREIVEVLHFVGATDKFISREFEKHFLRLGIKAGIVGATCAMIVFMCMPWLTELLGGGPVGAVEMQRLVGTGSLDALGYLILGFVVIIIAGLCTGTSRVGVHRILNGKH